MDSYSDLCGLCRAATIFPRIPYLALPSATSGEQQLIDHVGAFPASLNCNATIRIQTLDAGNPEQNTDVYTE